MSFKRRNAVLAVAVADPERFVRFVEQACSQDQLDAMVALLHLREEANENNAAYAVDSHRMEQLARVDDIPE